MLSRRTLLASLSLTAAPGALSAFSVEPAPAHIAEAHGSFVEARRRHAALLAEARQVLIDDGHAPEDADRLLGAYRCPDCGARTQTQ